MLHSAQGQLTFEMSRNTSLSIMASLATITILTPIYLATANFSDAAAYSPLMATCCLAFSAPYGRYSTVRSIVGGYGLAIAVGLAVSLSMLPGLTAAAAAVGATVLAMNRTRFLHPPAAGIPVLMTLGGVSSASALIVWGAGIAMVLCCSQLFRLFSAVPVESAEFCNNRPESDISRLPQE